MRIIAGESRGRKLASPPGRTSRPFLDSLKERVFSILGDVIVDAVVWDLFAGAGSCGLEAVSRGASGAVLVEKDRGTWEVLKKNVEALGYGDRVEALRGDAFAAAKHRAPVADVVFLDPPFPMVERDPRRIVGLMETLSGRMESGAIVFLRTPSATAPLEVAGFTLADRREVGVNRIEVHEVARA